MTFEELRVPSTDGLHDIYTRLYIPQGEPKGFVQFVHGMTEHIRRYDEIMKLLCEEGYIVFGHDHLGHGYTATDENELGYIAETNGWEILIDDVHAVLRTIKERFPDINKKTVLFGHSMGSFVVRLTVQKYPADYDDLIVCGTGGKNPAAPFGLVLLRLIRLFKGSRHRSNTVQKLAFGSYNKSFEGTSPYEWLTRDENVKKAYSEDKYCTFLFTVSAMQDLLRLNIKSNKQKWFESLKKDMNIFLISGSMDPVGNYGTGVQEVYNRIIKAGHEKTKIKLYKDGRHEILNETNNKEVYKDISDFIKSVTTEA